MPGQQQFLTLSAMVFPIKQLVALCRKYEVQDVFVDGAHAVGQVNVDLADIGADYYTSNAHKWLFAPTSVAFLHCKKQPGKEEPHHIVASLKYGRGLPQEASWAGTRDYSSFQAVYDCVEFINNELDPFLLSSGALTDEEWDRDTFPFRYSAWNHKKFLAYAKILTEGWGTSVASPDDTVGCLGMVELPSLPSAQLRTGAEALQLRHFLREKFAVEIVVDARRLTESESEYRAYVRLSVMVYTTSEDIVRLRDAVLAVRDGTAAFTLAQV